MNPQYYGAAARYNKSKGAKLFNRKTLLVGIIFVAVLSLIVMATALINNIAGGPRNDVARLAARASQFQSIIGSDLSNIQHPQLKKVAAETKLYLVSNSLALTAAYGAALPDSVLADEADAAVASDLSAAAKAGKHDATFLEVMKEKSLATLELAKKVQSQSSGPKTKAAADQMVNTMQLINDQLAAIKI
jgi:hypothetical protein